MRLRSGASCSSSSRGSSISLRSASRRPLGRDRPGCGHVDAIALVTLDREIPLVFLWSIVFGVMVCSRWTFLGAVSGGTPTGGFDRVEISTSYVVKDSLIGSGRRRTIIGLSSKLGSVEVL